jgi:hypothetical protein
MWRGDIAGSDMSTQHSKSSSAELLCIERIDDDCQMRSPDIAGQGLKDPGVGITAVAGVSLPVPDEFFHEGMRG